MADSTVKVFWLNKSNLMRSLGMGDMNPFVEQDPTQLINMPFTVTSEIGIKMQLLADQFEAAGGSAPGAALGQKKNSISGAKNGSLNKSEPPIIKALRGSDRLALDLRPDQEESKLVREQSEFTLVGHGGPVFSVSISLDDKYVISGS